MTKYKNKYGHRRAIGLAILGLLGLGLLIAMLLAGTDVRLFNPKGQIAQEQLNLMLISVALLLTIAVPTLVILYGFAWEYRESNQKAKYDPDVRQGKLFVFSMWAIPTVFMLLLASVMVPATYKLDPKKPIAVGVKPLTVKVVAMRWKWLFIYPEQNIATVNYVQVPTGTPVQFDLTADEAPMSSFWIPHLGGQLYAMAGHINRLNLIAEEPGDYPGSSAEINGAGFAGMKFTARASSVENFNLWVQDMQQSSGVLNSAEYAKLLKPSENNASAFYSPVEPDLYAKMLVKYMGSPDHQTAKQETGH